ncbi:MAG TPA: hypothetical protein VNL17_11125 [Verrucomicrobiae bacterium]|nr:hypothetical protein [Verrucomicrobiae bacterium]
MQLRHIVSGIAALTLAAGLAVRASAEEKGTTEKQLLLTDTPAPVQAAIKQFAGSNAIEKITKDSEDNKVIYEASVNIGGTKQAVEVSADGTVVRTEKTVGLKDTPSAVQSAIKKLAGSGTVDEVVEETAGGKKTYEAAVTIDGKKKEADIAADGTIQDGEEKEEHKGHGDGDKD